MVFFGKGMLYIWIVHHGTNNQCAGRTGMIIIKPIVLVSQYLQFLHRNSKYSHNTILSTSFSAPLPTPCGSMVRGSAVGSSPPCVYIADVFLVSSLSFYSFLILSQIVFFTSIVSSNRVFYCLIRRLSIVNLLMLLFLTLIYCFYLERYWSKYKLNCIWKYFIWSKCSTVV